MAGLSKILLFVEKQVLYITVEFWKVYPLFVILYIKQEGQFQCSKTSFIF